MKGADDGYTQKLEKELRDLKEQLSSQQEMYEMTALYLKKVENDLRATHNELLKTNKVLTDSINYSKRIQDVFLVDNDTLKKYFPNSFLFQKPKNVVSGDFLWANDNGKMVTLGLGDCTGHGVPAAMLSIFIISMLNLIISSNPKINPASLLESLDNLIIKYLSQASEILRDSAEISIIQFDRNSLKLIFSSAKRPLIHISDHNLIIHKGSKRVLGNYNGQKEPIDNIEIPVKKNDVLYMFSDGFTDQFGGQYSTKFTLKRLVNLLHEISDLPMNQQNDIIQTTFNNWKGEQNQIDDVLVVGLRV